MKGLKKRIFHWAFQLAERYDETETKNNRAYRTKLYWANRLVFKDVRKAFGGRLEFIISGGASLQPRLVRLFAAMDIPIIEGYGLTETSPVICTNSIALGIIKAGTVGVPCGSVDIKIDPETGEMLFAHCTIPLDMVERYDYDTHFESGIGVGIRGYMKEGPVTIFKLAGDLSRYFVAEGALVRNQAKPDLCRTQQVIALADKRQTSYFLTNPIGNHHIIMPGHQQTLIEGLLNSLGIEESTIKKNRE